MVKVINYISTIAVSGMILLIIVLSCKEKKDGFSLFTKGVEEGFKVVKDIFPVLLGLFVSIGMLRACGLLDLLANVFKPVLNFFYIPSEIFSLIALRPISGSSSIAVATDLMKNYGVDSRIGNMVSCIMGSTETTFYTIAVYTACVQKKSIRFALKVALIGDFVGVLSACFICNLLY